ncbi:unnamed protein product [Ceratitis capitata]|uniref:(Mediterranean fruit fly) hypothetical protein n=1 Tax=Ceratitis capitata TaxID=7213 RepID=A0A811VB65_CERCA|nr:unnamed protein product [Ceratitis capitata]
MSVYSNTAQLCSAVLNSRPWLNWLGWTARCIALRRCEEFVDEKPKLAAVLQWSSSLFRLLHFSSTNNQQTSKPTDQPTKQAINQTLEQQPILSASFGARPTVTAHITGETVKRQNGGSKG